ncbi:MAG: DUF2330 domain-containing protein [Myxococcales bacterium]|nr:DUF2330 domain-containing protein [Myxococcales bacterium]
MRHALITLALALLAPSAATAFCGFFVSGADAELYNDASQVVLMRKGNRTVMSMSNTYKGPPKDFAMVVPVPTVLQKEDVKTLAPDVFDRVDQLSAPRLVEYWEQDPCYVPPPPAARFMAGAMDDGAVMESGAGPDLGVKVEAQFEAGEYQIVILSAKEATGLDTWLRQNKYNIPKGADKALAPYITEGMKFFVAKVNIEKVKRDARGVVVLSPLRFSFESETLRLPVRLGLLNAQGHQDLLVYVLHPTKRFEVANYPNLFIPTNVEVLDKVRHSFGAFYVSLFDATLAKAGGKGVVTEYAWQTNGCDPCPVPPLTDGDLVTLGGDLLGLTAKPDDAKPVPGQPFFGPAASWVLTRLHTRYSKESLSEDLVFREAGAITGGRAEWGGKSVEQAGEVRQANANNFQGRYIIRHPWTGEVKCDNPNYGVWGGPPSGGEGSTKAATGLAAAPRGAVQLKAVVRSKLPALDIPGMPLPKRGK